MNPADHHQAHRLGRLRPWRSATATIYLLLVAVLTTFGSIAHAVLPSHEVHPNVANARANITPVPSPADLFRARDRFFTRAIPDVTPGIQAAISNKALELAAKSVLPIACDGLHMTILPDWGGETDSHLYNITDVSVTRVFIQDAGFDFSNKGKGGLITQMRNVSLHISFNWDVRTKPGTLTRNNRRRSRVVRARTSSSSALSDENIPRAYIAGEGPVYLRPNRFIDEGDDKNSTDSDDIDDNGTCDLDDDDDCHCGGVASTQPVRITGTGRVIYRRGTLRSVILMTTQGDPLHLKPAFNVTEATFTADRPELEINGSIPDELRTTLSEDFTKQGNKALSESILRRSQRAAERISRRIAQRMKTRVVCPVLGEYDMAFVTGVRPIRYYDNLKDASGKPVSAIAIALNGEMYTKENAHKPNPSDNVVPRDSAAVANAFKPSGRMVDVALSLFSLNSVLHAMCKAGGIHLILNRHTVPPQIQFPWNTKDWLPILPQLPMVFPNAEVEIEIMSASPKEPNLEEPRFHITDARMLDAVLRRRVTAIAPKEDRESQVSSTSEIVTGEGDAMILGEPMHWRSRVISTRTSFSPFIREVLRANPQSPAMMSPYVNALPTLPSFSTPRFRDKKGALALDTPLLVKLFVRPSIGPNAGKRLAALVLKADSTMEMTIDVKNHKPNPNNNGITSSEFATTIDNLSRPSRDAPFTSRPPVVANICPHNGVAASGSHRARRASAEASRRRAQAEARNGLGDAARRNRARLPILPHLSNGTRPCFYRSNHVRVTVPRTGTPRSTSSPLLHISSRLNVTHRRIRRIREPLFETAPVLISAPESRTVLTASFPNARSAPSARARARRHVVRAGRTAGSTTLLRSEADGGEGTVTRTAHVDLRHDRVGAVDAVDNLIRSALGSVAATANVRLGTRANIVTLDGTEARVAANHAGRAVRRVSTIHNNGGRMTINADNNVVQIDDYEIDLTRNNPTAAAVAHLLRRIRNSMPVVAPPEVAEPAKEPAVAVQAPPVRVPIARPGPQPPTTATPAPRPVEKPLKPRRPCRRTMPKPLPDLHSPVPLGLPVPYPNNRDNASRESNRVPRRPRRSCPVMNRYRGDEDFTRIYPRITGAAVTFAVVESMIGRVDPTRLNRLVSAFLDLVLIPTVNQRLERGFPLYCPAGYQMENVTIEFKNNAINIGSDVRYRPPVHLLREIRAAFAAVRYRELVRRAIQRLRARRLAGRRSGPLVGH